MTLTYTLQAPMAGNFIFVCQPLCSHQPKCHTISNIRHKASSQHLDSARILIQWLWLKFQAWHCHFYVYLQDLVKYCVYHHQSVQRHLLKILCWFGDIDLNWNQVLIGQHLDPWPISFALLIKAQWLCLSPRRCSTNFREILVLCQNTPCFMHAYYFVVAV